LRKHRDHETYAARGADVVGKMRVSSDKLNPHAYDQDRLGPSISDPTLQSHGRDVEAEASTDAEQHANEGLLTMAPVAIRDLGVVRNWVLPLEAGDPFDPASSAPPMRREP